MLYIIFAILMFGLLIAVHEGGHFVAARLLGVRVNEFSLGMGPTVWKKQGKETCYSIRLFPIGGFCAMEGEDEDSDSPRAFGNQRAWKRLIILVAGAAMNFLTGLVILIVLYAGANYYISTEVSGMLEGSPSQEYFLPGDRIVSINGNRILVHDDFSTLLARGNGKTADFVVLRGGEKIGLENIPCHTYQYTAEDGTTSVLYGFQFTWKEHTPGTRVSTAIFRAADFVRMVWWGLEDLIAGTAGVNDLTGPIGIVSAMGDVGASSASTADAFLNLLYFASFIAVNLAVMNLLPLPALDGGRIFFIVLNGVIWLVCRRKIPEKYEGYIHAAGLFILLGIMVIVAFHDVIRIWNT